MMPDVFAAISNFIVEYLLGPIILAVATAVLFVLKYVFDKASKEIVAKKELADLEKETNIRKELMETIANDVEAAVASNMQLAEAMKQGGHKLSDEEAKKLHDNAKMLVLNALPVSLTQSGGVLNEIIGGTDKLNSIIDAMMEKYVYEYKVKKLQAEGIIPSQKPPETLKEAIAKKPINKRKPLR